MSKQLETAHGKLFGLDIDLVNLRKEVYSGHSRTPEMEFGRPEEDALRRDATVNALFFHLQRQEVVDLTGKGLADLEARLIRTPLDPRQTFMDDPLRVLRLIRIDAKLNFTIDANTLYWMRQDEIRRALDTIVTRDRISMELLKVMKGQNPEVAFRYIFESNLFVPVFIRFSSPLLDTLKAAFPEQSDSSWPQSWPRAYHLLAALSKDNGSLGTLVRSEENVENLWILAAFAPMAVLRQHMLKEAVQDATTAIRTTAKTSKLLENALKSFDQIDRTVLSVAAEAETNRRSIVGMAIPSWGMTWASQVVYVMLAQAVDNQKVSADSNESYVDTLKWRYAVFAKFVWDNKLQAAHLQRPLLDGHQIQALFGMDGGGKYLKEATEELVRWQFDHVDATVDESRAWLHARRSEFVGFT